MAGIVAARNVAIGIVGCASLLLGGCTNTVMITSDPSGASVSIDGVGCGETPLTAEVTWSAIERNHITLKHPDCHTFHTMLQRTLRLPEGDNAAPAAAAFVICSYGAGIFAFVGPIKEQHFILAPLSPESDGGTPTAQDEKDVQREKAARAAIQKAIAEAADLTSRDELGTAGLLLDALERAHGGTKAYEEQRETIKALLDIVRTGASSE